MRSTRSQLAKHRRGRLPCWTDITDRLRGKRAENPKEYRGTDPAHIPDRVSAEVTATMVESKRRTTRRFPIEDYVPIPEKHRASPVRKSVSEKRIPSESIHARRLMVVQLLRLVHPNQARLQSRRDLARQLVRDFFQHEAETNECLQL